ncbi:MULTISPECIES: DUF5988 family protein [Saccharopolyspora]|uniref:DUF5988 family protein n=1 Tax=Saccharopolyspora TaxID=1835 RepID=UPI001A9EFB22|nr:DUF5988 family protein [Saccharopolyspora elongata]
MSGDGEVILEGGPVGIPTQVTAAEVDLAERIKIRRLNGYDHFERTEDYREVGDSNLPVFRWAYRTQVAE